MIGVWTDHELRGFCSSSAENKVPFRSQYHRGFGRTCACGNCQRLLWDKVLFRIVFWGVTVAGWAGERPAVIEMMVWHRRSKLRLCTTVQSWRESLGCLHIILRGAALCAFGVSGRTGSERICSYECCCIFPSESNFRMLFFSYKVSLKNSPLMHVIVFWWQLDDSPVHHVAGDKLNSINRVPSPPVVTKLSCTS